MVGFYFLGHKAAAGIAKGADVVGDAVNPTSADNLIYKGLNAVGDVFDDGGDNDSFSLGSSIYDLLNPEAGV
ncbi:MAG: hypothetical protein KBT88_03485 [Gammaproteobacteria bacterium]|nr:hypothetical protein [Gammaproteobacteria bacterium]MBQ0838823.1 hypothetical protein [Gammaproteobacteria bacterium]